MASRAYPLTDHHSTLVPLSGGIIRHAEYFVDPALSFAQGWNSVYNYLVSIPAELTAAAVIVSFWDTTTTAAAWIVLFGGLLVIANLLFVRVYGEMEFVFASLKIMLIIGLNIMVRFSTLTLPSQRNMWLTPAGSTGYRDRRRRRPRPPGDRLQVLA